MRNIWMSCKLIVASHNHPLTVGCFEENATHLRSPFFVSETSVSSQTINHSQVSWYLASLASLVRPLLRLAWKKGQTYRPGRTVRCFYDPSFNCMQRSFFLSSLLCCEKHGFKAERGCRACRPIIFCAKNPSPHGSHNQKSYQSCLSWSMCYVSSFDTSSTLCIIISIHPS